MTSSHAMSYNQDNHPFICFHYIHQNPLKANLVEQMEDWEMSYYKDYTGLRSGTLCNQQLAKDLLDIPLNHSDFIEQSKQIQCF